MSIDSFRWGIVSAVAKHRSVFLRRLASLGVGGLSLGLLAIASAQHARAGSFSVSFTVADSSNGRYTYEYRILGSPLPVGDDLAIYFPVSTSADLKDLGTGGTQFTTFAFQPDPAIPADGEFDVLALSNQSNSSATFDVSFLYTGQGLPGAQAFTLYNSAFDIVAVGTTTAAGMSPSPTPEPASFCLLATGLALAYSVRRRSAA